MKRTKFTSESRSAPTLPSMAAKSRENAPGNQNLNIKRKKEEKKKKKRVVSHFGRQKPKIKRNIRKANSATTVVSQFSHAKPSPSSFLSYS